MHSPLCQLKRTRSECPAKWDFAFLNNRLANWGTTFLNLAGSRKLAHSELSDYIFLNFCLTFILNQLY